MTVFLVALVVAVLSCIYWLQTPAAEKVISKKLTAQMQLSVPKTELRVEGISLQFPLEIKIQRVIWRTADAEPIAMISPCAVRIRPRGLSANRLAWEIEGPVTRLRIASLDRAVGNGEWRASGEAAGSLQASGTGSQLEQIRFHVEIVRPGGGLSSEFLLRLLGMMPDDSSKAVLFKTLARRPIVHFSTGRISLITENENYLLKLWMDGDHLLDITIRVPKESLSLIGYLLQ